MKVTIEQIEKALEASGGFQTIAAKKLGIGDSALSERILKTPQLIGKLAQIKERTLDLSEAQLVKKIKKGSLGAICFYLKYQGQGRGYKYQPAVNTVVLPVLPVLPMNMKKLAETFVVEIDQDESQPRLCNTSDQLPEESDV